ncbi:MAG: hypothetical protein WBK91_04030 [Alphaproteobacteria bacterium]
MVDLPFAIRRVDEILGDYSDPSRKVSNLMNLAMHDGGDDAAMLAIIMRLVEQVERSKRSSSGSMPHASSVPCVPPNHGAGR